MASVSSAVNLMSLGFQSIDINRKLLVHFDSASVDSGPNNHTVTLNSTASVSATNAKFGGGCLLLNGTSDFVDLTGTLGDFAFGTGDFTVEGWFKTSTKTTSGGTLRALWLTEFTTVTGSLAALINSTTGVLDIYYNNGGGATVQCSSTTDITDNTNRHIALSRTGTTMKLFIAGAQEASITFSSSVACATRLRIGANNGTGFFQGNVDELSVSNVGRWTAAFTPPGVPYS